MLDYAGRSGSFVLSGVSILGVLLRDQHRCFYRALAGKGAAWRVALSVLALAPYLAYNSIYAVKIDLDEVPELRVPVTVIQRLTVSITRNPYRFTVPYFNVGSTISLVSRRGRNRSARSTLSTQTGLLTTSYAYPTPCGRPSGRYSLFWNSYRILTILDDFNQSRFCCW